EGVSLTLIAEAVFARNLSARTEERVKASALLAGPDARKQSAVPDDEAKETLLQGLHEALLAAKMVSYAQGFALMKAAAEHYGWPLDYGRIALLWRGGCIIRSVFLEQIKKAFDEEASLDNLMLAPWFRARLAKAQQGWRQVVSTAVLSGIATPALSAALAYYDGYRCDRSPANLLQAQRDFFGAHTYERIDRPRGEFFHTRWNP
ncbi:MAG: NADP-dependent phosphogluconate dehydrogenase, partial [Bacteroidales bacterium]|nr:NADP-dependent phosphogluconate dehydrogenase [Bacteroidales bacterium]